MREIKFKAKRLDSGEWVKGSLIRSTAGIKEKAYIVDNFSSMSNYSVIGVDSNTICQFTGLKDCEGNEVWEHDLLQSEITKAIYEVIWYEDCGFIIKDSVDGGYFPALLGSVLRIINYKVVGNKFDKEK